MTALDLGYLRDTGLNAWELNTLKVLGENGGQIRWHSHTIKNPNTAPYLQLAIKKGIVQLVAGDLGAEYLRLTEQGRHALTQVEKMDATKKIIVDSTNEAPPDGLL